MSDATVIPDKEHALVSPSGFERAENCPGSVSYAASMKHVDTTTEYTAEGTVAHQVLETCLLDGVEPLELLGDTYQVGEFEFVVDVEMADFVSNSLDIIREETAAYTDVEIESKLMFPDGIGYGYADVVATADDRNHVLVLDLKYGAGVMVDSDSIQLAIYALCAFVRDYGEAALFDGSPTEIVARTVVLQPRGRSAHPEPKDWTREEMRGVLARLRHTLEKVAGGDRTLKFGEKWCRFCPAIAMCPALRQAAKDAVMVRVAGSPQVLDELDYTAQQMDDALAMIPAIDMWVKKVNAMAMDYLEAGGALTNAKLVAKRAVRKWSDPDMAQAFMEAHGIEPWQEPKLLTAPMAEKKLPKNARAEIADLVVKESSGNTLAPMDDKRPAVAMKMEAGKAALRQQTARRILSRANNLASPNEIDHSDRPVSDVPAQ